MLYNLLKWWIKLKLPVKAKWKAILFAIFIAAMEKQPNSWTACCLQFISIHGNQRKCLDEQRYQEELHLEMHNTLSKPLAFLGRANSNFVLCLSELIQEFLSDLWDSKECLRKLVYHPRLKFHQSCQALTSVNQASYALIPWPLAGNPENQQKMLRPQGAATLLPSRIQLDRDCPEITV